MVDQYTLLMNGPPGVIVRFIPKLSITSRTCEFKDLTYTNGQINQ